MEIERATGQPQGPCWCVNTSFAPGLLAQLPPEAEGKACICAACVARFAAGGAA
jgi:Cysteine-rich CWC